MKCCPSPRLLHLDAGSRCQECGLFIPRSANDRRPWGSLSLRQQDDRIRIAFAKATMRRLRRERVAR